MVLQKMFASKKNKIAPPHPHQSLRYVFCKKFFLQKNKIAPPHPHPSSLQLIGIVIPYHHKKKFSCVNIQELGWGCGGAILFSGIVHFEIAFLSTLKCHRLYFCNTSLCLFGQSMIHYKQLWWHSIMKCCATQYRKHTQPIYRSYNLQQQMKLTQYAKTIQPKQLTNKMAMTISILDQQNCV